MTYIDFYVAILSLQRMLLKELPHNLIGRNVLGRLADEADRRLLAWPSVSPIFDSDEDNVCPGLAATVSLACHFQLIVVFGNCLTHASLVALR